MKSLRYLLLILFITISHIMSAQSFETFTNPDDGVTYYVGSMTREQLSEVNGFENLSINNDEDVNMTIINSWKDAILSYEITAFIGTWCQDSQYNFPTFMNVMKQAQYPIENIKIWALDLHKHAPNKIEETYNILYVPTFIFSKDGKEVFRIVEQANESFEKDILQHVQSSH